MSQTLYIVRGLPGSGKSTFAYQMMLQGLAEHIETDMFFERDGEYRFDPSLIVAAHKWCQDTTDGALASGENIVVSNTFTQKWEMQPYLDMAEKHNIPVVVYRCTGEYDNIHNVPENVQERMKSRFEDFPGEIFV